MKKSDVKDISCGRRQAQVRGGPAQQMAGLESFASVFAKEQSAERIARIGLGLP